MRVGGIVVFVSRLVLLFTRRDKVDGALGERFGLSLSLCHVAMGVAFGSLLIPITRVAGVVDRGKRLQHETSPVVACYARTAYVQREAECGQVTLAYTREHFAALADEQRCRGERQTLAHSTGCMVHTSFPGIFVFQFFVAQSRSFSTRICMGRSTSTLSPAFHCRCSLT